MVESSKRKYDWYSVPLQKAAKGVEAGMAWLQKEHPDVTLRYIQENITDCGSTGWVGYFCEVTANGI